VPDAVLLVYVDNDIEAIDAASIRAIGSNPWGHPRLAANALEVVGTQTQEMLHRLREFAMDPVERRIARALLRLVGQAGRRVGAGLEIDFPLSRQDIAEMTGTTLYTVSRTLREWERRGVVQSARRRVVVRDPARLGEMGANQSRSRPREGA